MGTSQMPGRPWGAASQMLRHYAVQESSIHCPEHHNRYSLSKLASSCVHSPKCYPMRCEAPQGCPSPDVLTNYLLSLIRFSSALDLLEETAFLCCRISIENTHADLYYMLYSPSSLQVASHWKEGRKKLGSGNEFFAGMGKENRKE